MKIYIDISNLLTTTFITGIQRVVREVIVRMNNNDSYELKFLVYDEANEKFLNINRDGFLAQLNEGNLDKKKCVESVFQIGDIEPNSIWFDIDGVWHSTKKRAYLYPDLTMKGIKIINMIYDVIPITGPSYCHENTVMSFIVYFGAVLKYSSLIIVNAQATKEHIKAIATELNIKMPECEVIPLGADFGTAKKKTDKDEQSAIGTETRKAIDSGKYILMVGTLEPRKNHGYVLDALDKGLAVNVVFAGRQGWNVDDLVERIKSHPQLGNKLFWINNASDKDIDELYKNAYYVVFPTKDEGFGLPVIESVMRGVPVIASNIPVVKEVGEDYVSYISISEPEQLVRYIRATLIDETRYLEDLNRIENYVGFTWEDCEKRIEDIIQKYSI